MKKILIALIAVAALVAPSVAADNEKQMTSRITGVTVFPDRAQIERQAEVALSPGVYKLVVADLNGGIIDGSLRGSGVGTAKVKILGLAISRQFLPAAGEAQVQALEDKIEALEIEYEAQNHAQSIVDIENSYLNSLVSAFSSFYNRGVLTGQSNGARLTATEKLVAKRLGLIAQRKGDIEKKKRDLNKQLSKLREELNKLRYPGDTKKKTLAVDIECASGGNFTLSFNYTIMNASWNPIYDIRSEGGKGKIEVVSKAQVRQKTGEDWNNVALVLSTASPSVGGDMPEPQALVLDFAPEVSYDKRSGGPGGYGLKKRAEAPAEYAADAAPEPEPVLEMTASVAQVVTGETAVEFKIEKRKTIVSDGKPNLVPLGADSFEGEVKYVTLPSENEYAYLMAKVKNTSDRTFLAGPANIFMAGKFVGKASIPMWSPDEKIDVPLGIDESVKVERKLINRKKDTLLGKTTIEYQWKIEITNNRSESIDITIYEPIPKSRHNDIELQNVVIEPKPTDFNAENGKVKWELTLAAGGKQRINVSYTVKFPSGRTVENLP